jgi:hypothetical protein
LIVYIVLFFVLFLTFTCAYQGRQKKIEEALIRKPDCGKFELRDGSLVKGCYVFIEGYGIAMDSIGKEITDFTNFYPEGRLVKSSLN